MSAQWHFKTTEPFFPQGRDTTRPNFSREERSEIGILIREGLQNPLDARRDDSSGPVRVTMRNLESGAFDSGYLERIVTKDFRERLKTASNVTLPPVSEATVFVIEDFGTKGLLGEVTNYDTDGPGQNWNAFWHREGEGAKDRASNGGAGQGKVTYFTHSNASVVLGLTVRSSDKQRLLMGRAAFLRDYQFRDGAKYYRTAYWTTSDSRPTPERDPTELDRFIAAFKLARDPSEPGLSLVVPFARQFEHKEAVTSVILDFYMPIAAGRLDVTIGETHISSKTIDTIADRFIRNEDVLKAGSSFSKAYRAFASGILSDPHTQLTLPPTWNRERTIAASIFPDGMLKTLQDQLESGARVAIKLPLLLKMRAGQTFNTTFDVFIECPSDLDRNEEAFVRRDLLVGAESHVAAGAFVQKARSMTWVQDRDLSDFLLAAEEPTHLKWNASLARDKGDYVSPDVALRSIRQAVPRLLTLLLGTGARKDLKSLARYFSKPATEPTRKPGDEGQNRKKQQVVPPPEPPPPPARKPFRIESDGTALRVVPNGSSGPEKTRLPMRAVLELAYEGLDQDPFAAYDPYDFDVAQAAAYPLHASGVTVVSRAGNKVELEVREPDFSFEIGGFDQNVRMRARLNYDGPDDLDGETQGEE